MKGENTWGGDGEEGDLREGTADETMEWTIYEIGEDKGKGHGRLFLR